MDLRNNAIGRNLAINTSLDGSSYDEMFNYALERGLLITDANRAYEYFGIGDVADSANRILVKWNVEQDVLYVLQNNKTKYTIHLGS